MEINGKEYKIEELINTLDIKKDFYQRRENGLLLNDRQVEVLKKNGIDYRNYSNLSSLLFALNETLNEIEDAELEQTLKELEEIHYYQETEK